ncbi:MAG TPA: TorF family putative porin [Pseudolabrys sp.]|jgi:uncharacterized protein (TIGR02001 family)|nr:TorF family putative porin [Pseudolabrys sp.]
MKKVVVSLVAALAVSAAAPALASDMPVKAAKAPVVAAPPSPWDVAFGAAIMNDYVWRGVTQSGHKPSVAAYFEPRYNIDANWQLYAGISGESIKFANNAAAEIDFYGGVRPTFGPVAFDVGFWYYYYPGGTCYAGNAACPATIPNGNVAKSVASFYEVYGKVTYTIGDFALGANEYYSPNFLNTGAWGNYASGTIKYTAPEKLALGPLGWYVSGEFGRQWLGTSDAFYGVPAFPNGIDYKDYNTWNVGIGFTYKVFTLDLRYSDTDLNKGDCNAFTSDPGGSGTTNVTPINPTGVGSNWCGATFIAKLSADLTLGSLK